MSGLYASVVLNPCMDHTAHISGFNYGGLNRVVKSRADIGGKGVNVGVVLKNLLAGSGAEVLCAGFCSESAMGGLEGFLKKNGIASDFVVCPGRLRTNIKIFEEKTGTMTEFNERGDHVGDSHRRELVKKISLLAPGAKAFVFSGSAPPGVEDGYYRELICAAREANPDVIVALDADGGLLGEGINAAPDIVKPNLFELSGLAGENLSGHADIIKACRVVIDKGVKIVCVSMGAEGAIITDGFKAYFAPALDILVKGVQGAGDSLTAGLCVSYAEGAPLGEMLRSAAAAAGGSLIREGTLLCGKEDYLQLKDKVKVIEIDV